MVGSTLRASSAHIFTLKLDTGVGKQGKLEATDQVNLSPVSAKLKVDTKDIDLRVAQSYISPFIRLELRSGMLGSNLDVNLKSTAPLAFQVTGRAQLEAKANRLAGSLPLLDRKRLELARALATRPRTLLLDEIAGGLTDAECHELVETIRTIHAEGVAIIWIEHVVHAMLAVVQRLVGAAPRRCSRTLWQRVGPSRTLSSLPR
ncbi:DUF748 domain-containing protein [Acidovorax sp. BLS4]|uniref:DUF748 domain-containing protein n=1 Tax=Acidovorax sp. BLS4 TaxID=3273430 RepID=UPI0029436258|nr:DUF748 domain-containing protein [Paracidovorax avenae]WOI45604.1 DUF748 domain-containing protein [Paracidovorax avenae]